MRNCFSVSFSIQRRLSLVAFLLFFFKVLLFPPRSLPVWDVPHFSVLRFLANCGEKHFRAPGVFPDVPKLGLSVFYARQFLFPGLFLFSFSPPNLGRVGSGFPNWDARRRFQIGSLVHPLPSHFFSDKLADVIPVPSSSAVSSFSFCLDAGSTNAFLVSCDNNFGAKNLGLTLWPLV